MGRYNIICVVFSLSMVFCSHADSAAGDLTFSKQAQEYRKIGYAAYIQGNLDKAYQFFKKASYLNPNYAIIHNDLGIIYDKRGFKELALKEYLEAIRLDPQYAPAYMNLALLYRELGNREKAAFYLKERAGLGKGKDLWRNRAEQLLEEYGTSVKKNALQAREKISEAALIELDSAETLMEQSIREKIGSAEAAAPKIEDYFNSAKLNYQKGAYGKALEEFEEAQRQAPDSVEIAGYVRDCEDKVYIDNLYKEGKSALGRGDFALAISKISELLSLDPIYKNAEEILASAEKERFIQETKSKDEPIILRMP